jgi:hypothetical protein
MNDKVDLSHINLLILTPIGDRSEYKYNSALDKTKQIIRQHGGQVECFNTIGVSEISFARSRLIGAFHRAKQFTHCMMIDADQSWEPEEVVWFLLLKRDMLAAISCKKTYPIEFAWNMTDENGKLWPLHHELETNVTTVPFAGAAFMMLSRSCIDRMIAAYPELEYDLEDTVEYGLFDPMIINRRRFAEDYSFCYRWRRIGGEVEVKMDVNLSHIGSHTFTGQLMDYLLKNQPKTKVTLHHG